MTTQINLAATVIEISPAVGYSTIRFQLSSDDGSATTGDCFNVAIEDVSGYEVGQSFEIKLCPQ